MRWDKGLITGKNKGLEHMVLEEAREGGRGSHQVAGGSKWGKMKRKARDTLKVEEGENASLPYCRIGNRPCETDATRNANRERVRGGGEKRKDARIWSWNRGEDSLRRVRKRKQWSFSEQNLRKELVEEVTRGRNDLFSAGGYACRKLTRPLVIIAVSTPRIGEGRGCSRGRGGPSKSKVCCKEKHVHRKKSVEEVTLVFGQLKVSAEYTAKSRRSTHPRKGHVGGQKCSRPEREDDLTSGGERTEAWECWEGGRTGK